MTQQEAMKLVFDLKVACEKLSGVSNILLAARIALENSPAPNTTPKQNGLWINAIRSADRAISEKLVVVNRIKKQLYEKQVPYEVYCNDLNAGEKDEHPELLPDGSPLFV